LMSFCALHRSLLLLTHLITDTSAQVVNSHLVCDPTIWQLGFDLPRQQWSLQMKTLFHGWPVMVHDTHTRRRRRLTHFSCCVRKRIVVCTCHANFVSVHNSNCRMQMICWWLLIQLLLKL